jgi:hypothetical protein
MAMQLARVLSAFRSALREPTGADGDGDTVTVPSSVHSQGMYYPYMSHHSNENGNIVNFTYVPRLFDENCYFVVKSPSVRTYASISLARLDFNSIAPLYGKFLIASFRRSNPFIPVHTCP